jgi:hypothetical protein
MAPISHDFCIALIEQQQYTAFIDFDIANIFSRMIGHVTSTIRSTHSSNAHEFTLVAVNYLFFVTDADEQRAIRR